MRLREFFSDDAISLGLTGSGQDEILNELIALLKVDPKAQETLFRLLKRREQLGSTGVGHGIAIPHCRSLAVTRLRLAFGHRPGGVEYQAIDAQPVFSFFLIVAPPLEVSNHYLPVLSRIAQLAKEPDVPLRLGQLKSAEEFFGLLEEKGV